MAYNPTPRLAGWDYKLFLSGTELQFGLTDLPQVAVFVLEKETPFCLAVSPAK
jgi:hypothetical protein